MKIHFRIDTDGGIAAYPTKGEAQAAVATEGGVIFATRAELADLGKTLPMQTLVDAWNSLTGVTPVKRFKDRPRMVRKSDLLESSGAAELCRLAIMHSKDAESPGPIPVFTNRRRRLDEPASTARH